jgi:hypothetical protein
LLGLGGGALSAGGARAVASAAPEHQARAGSRVLGSSNSMGGGSRSCGARRGARTPAGLVRRYSRAARARAVRGRGAREGGRRVRGRGPAGAPAPRAAPGGRRRGGGRSGGGARGAARRGRALGRRGAGAPVVFRGFGGLGVARALCWCPSGAPGDARFRSAGWDRVRGGGAHAKACSGERSCRRASPQPAWPAGPRGRGFVRWRAPEGGEPGRGGRAGGGSLHRGGA